MNRSDWLHQERRELVDMLHAEGIHDERVLAAIERVPRERFVAPDQAADAYANGPLPIGERQTISQPFVVALMTEALQLAGDERVLEVGTGSGYHAAVLAELARHVVSVERHWALYDKARSILNTLGYQNVELHLANGTLGWVPGAPYNRITVAAAAPDIPAALTGQLGDGGRLVIPVGNAEHQRLLLVLRRGERLERVDLGPVRFVPLIGRDGWADDPT